MPQKYRVMSLPGDGIGKEVIREAIRVLEWFIERRSLDVDIQHRQFGAEYYLDTGVFMQENTFADLMASDVVLFGAMGGTLETRPIPQEIRRRFGLLRIRREMNLFANLRPIRAMPSLKNASPLKEEVRRGVDFIIVRELIGGIYFGEPRGVETLPDGQRRGYNTQSYTTSEIQRIGRVAFDIARNRKKCVTSVDKANVLESSAVWREEMSALHKAEFPEIALSHLYVDACSLEVIRRPRDFDVIVTDNIFGDILSDGAAAVAGALGMLPSAALGPLLDNGRRRAFYEPVHGSAPDIAGQGKANPTAAILSVGMALELSFNRSDDARLLETAVDDALTGCRTADIAEPGVPTVSTSAFTDAVLHSLGRHSGDIQ